MTGKVYLVGAGPGDAELFTLKGMRVLQNADVVVYDHLIPESLLNMTKPEAEWVDAGKYAGDHHMKQTDIEALLIEKARAGLQVVRLKGGDPFIFGRGGEEGMALASAGIPFEVVPGISSAYSAAAYCGIPVTHRGMASSFHVITGHEDPAKEGSALDYGTLAKEEGTLVFLMALSRLSEISRQLIEKGKDSRTPAAVIASGTTAKQQCVTSKLDSIAACANKAGVRPPALLVVGDVAELREQLNWQQEGPLSGRKILVTASGAIAERQAAMILELGGEPVLLSLIDICPIQGLRLEPVLERVDDGAWIVFTSRNGVEVFFHQLQSEALDLRMLAGKKIAVMGSGTEKALEAHGLYADLVPERACSESLAEVLAHVGAERVFLFRAKEGSDILPEKLCAAGICCVDTALYETRRLWKKAALLRQLAGEVDVISFCSASAVDAFAQMMKSELSDDKSALGLASLTAAIVCIGPVAAEAARQRGMRVDGVAKTYNLEGLMGALVS